MTSLRRLDHVAIMVRDTEAALSYFSGRLGLEVVHVDELERPPVRLTYLDCGNAFIQLVEPLDPAHELARGLDERGEGLHHICFGVDDVARAVEELSEPAMERTPLGSGRGRISGFIANGCLHGVLLECTGFDIEKDVAESPGWLPGEGCSSDSA